VAPGQFQESASGRRVFFLDKDTPDNKSGKNIFISSIERDRETVTSARSGHVETMGDSQFLLLQNGQRLENSLKGEGLRISEFEEHGSKVSGGLPDRWTDAGPPSPLHAHAAARAHPVNLGELAWRLGLALAASTSCCWRSRCPASTRAWAAAATWSSRCSPSSSTSTC
jgi:lipopolysaccharide export system permease protein